MNQIKYRFYGGGKEDLPLFVIPYFDNSSKNLINLLVKENIKINIIFIYDLDRPNDLTPWEATYFLKGEVSCEGNADALIDFITNFLCNDIIKKFNLNPSFKAFIGLSLGGLFAIYLAFKTNYFQKIGCVSGSLWYPKFVDFVENSKVLEGISTIYLSLGDKEKNTKNELMKNVEIDTLKCFDLIKCKVNNSFFEFTKGNHFKNTNKRIVNAIKYLLLN